LNGLAEMLGQNSLIDPAQIDVGLLWMTVVALLRHGAAIHLGVNKAKSSIVVTIYDGDFPFKQFCDSIEQLHFTLAAVVKSYEKRDLPPDWQEVIEKYFPKR